MIVVLDSSVLCQDLRLSGSSSQVFFGNVQVVPATVIVPEVVIDEVTNHFRERLTEAQSALVEAKRKLDALLSALHKQPELTPVDPEVVTYKQFLLKQVSDVGGQILPYPNTTHQKIVQRELQRRKPFKTNGAGYRDLLIWESIRGLTRSGHERVAFATANTKDFAEGDRLHDDLASDILNPERVEIFTSLKDFNDKHILPRLDTVNQFHGELDNVIVGKPNLAHWIREHLLDILKDEDLGFVISPVPDTGRFWPHEVVSFDDMQAVSVRRLQNSELVCDVVVCASIDIAVDIEAEDYYRHSDVREWLGGPNYGSWNEVVALAISIDLIVDPSTSRVTSHEVTNVDIACGSSTV